MIIRTANGRVFSFDKGSPEHAVDLAKFLLFTLPKLHKGGDLLEAGQLPELLVTPEVEQLMSIANRIKQNQYNKHQASMQFDDDIPF